MIRFGLSEGRGSKMTLGFASFRISLGIFDSIPHAAPKARSSPVLNVVYG